MNTHPIVVAPAFPALPAALRYPQNGVDRLGATTWGLVSQDVADAFGWFYGVVTSGVGGAPSLASLAVDNDFLGVQTFEAGVSFNGAVSFADDVEAALTYKLTSRSLTRVVATPGLPNNGTDWTLGVNGIYSQVTTNGGAVGLLFPLDIPHGSTLTGVSTQIIGAGGHGGVPGILPVLELRSITTAGVLSGVIASAGDPYTSAGVYQAIHTLSIAHSLAFNKSTTRYLARLGGEGGANFVAGLSVYAVSWTATVTAQDDGAG